MEQLARKYRPQALAHLVGQPTIVQTLTNAFNKGQLHQAYLLVGQFGSGKTSAARVLAAMENCETGRTLEPCGKCPLCVAIFKGEHEDIREIDAASAAGKVEQIRELKNDASYTSIDGARVKYFIIDEAHRMSDAASESLLKLVEEPPEHIRFILCTTDPQRIKPTIQSRCQRHDFRKIYWREMSDRLAGVARNENYEVDENALHLCSRLAEGSMRNALQNLEKLFCYIEGSKATLEDAEALFGTPGEMAYYDLIDQIIGTVDGKPNVTTGFRLINEMFRNGCEFEVVFKTLATRFHDLVVGLTSKEAYEFLSVSTAGRHRLATQLEHLKTKLAGVIECIENLHEAKRSVLFNIPPEEALQTWFVRCVYSIRR